MIHRNFGTVQVSYTTKYRVTCCFSRLALYHLGGKHTSSGNRSIFRFFIVVVPYPISICTTFFIYNLDCTIISLFSFFSTTATSSMAFTDNEACQTGCFQPLQMQPGWPQTAAVPSLLEVALPPNQPQTGLSTRTS